ncbi:hypothetical protein [uncultured Thermomonospora sp.]|uniref:hypothetical protein n=1 Tax=uncultured Thermomonospora sp. TaxID=671175 RepID=UPI00259B4C7C|nr:hypothetical protein [uncultured Thermomonospora sp.]
MLPEGCPTLCRGRREALADAATRHSIDLDLHKVRRYQPPHLHRLLAVRPMSRLDWSGRRQGNSRAHWLGRRLPCRICHRLTFLCDDTGAPCHKVCAENQRQTLERPA